MFRGHAKFVGGASSETIADAESKLGTRFPFVLKEVLKISDGLADHNGHSHIWSTSEIVSLNHAARTDAKFLNAYMPLNNFLFFSKAPCDGMFGF